MTDPTNTAAGAQVSFLGVLMHVDHSAARALLLDPDLTPAPWETTAAGLIYTAITDLVDRQLTPIPIAIANHLTHSTGFTMLPASVRGRVLTAVYEVFGEAPPAVMAGHVRGLVVEGAVWQRIRNSAVRVTEAQGKGATLDQLAELLATQFGTVPEYVSRALAVVG